MGKARVIFTTIGWLLFLTFFLYLFINYSTKPEHMIVLMSIGFILYGVLNLLNCNERVIDALRIIIVFMFAVWMYTEKSVRWFSIIFLLVGLKLVYDYYKGD